MRGVIISFLVLLPSLAAAQTPVLQVSPKSLSFITTGASAVPLPQEVRIRNQGSGTLEWRAIASVPWLLLSPPSGTAPGILTVAIDTARLPVGTHSGRVTVSATVDADDSPAVIEVAVQIVAVAPASERTPQALPAAATPEPPLLLSALAGSATPVTSTVTIEFATGGAVAWSATSNQPWLTITPSRGTASTNVTVRAQPTGLEPGPHEAIVRVVDGDSAELLVMPITLTVGGAAGAVPAPAQNSSLSIGVTSLPPATRNLPYSQAIPIKGGKPPYTIRILQGRLPLGLAMANGAISGLTRFAGSYQLVLGVTDSSTPPQSVNQQVLLRVIVLYQSTALAISPSAISVSVTGTRRPQAARLTVSSGGPSLEWRAKADAAWLRLSPAAGASPSVIQIDVNPAGLAPGVYVGTITVTMDGAPNSPATVPVQVVIRK